MNPSQTKIVNPAIAAERQKKIEMMKEKLKKKRELELKARTFVEFLSINQHVTEDQLSTMLKLLFVQQYDDVIEERTISSFCGYPLCAASLINVPKKKYHISQNTSTVYDIEKRKKFCSNNCYLSSKHLRKQISEEPLLERINNATKFDYLKDHSKFKTSEGMGDIILQPSSLRIASEVESLKKKHIDDDDDYDDDDNDDRNNNNEDYDYNGFDYDDDEQEVEDDDGDDKVEKNYKEPKMNVEKRMKTETRRSVLLQASALSSTSSTSASTTTTSSTPMVIMTSDCDEYLFEKVHKYMLEWRTDSTYLFNEKNEMDDADEVSASGKDDKVLVLPATDHKDIMLIRRGVVLEKLGPVLMKYSEILKVNQSIIMTNVRSLVLTFNFSNTNIIMKPLEWMMAGLIILHVVSKKDEGLRKKLDQTNMHNTFVKKFNITRQQFDKTAVEILSKPSVYR